MNAAILESYVQDFINTHLKTDPTAIILKGLPFTEVSVKEVVEQIEAKNKCEKKLPHWFFQPGIYYPNKLNIEQTSSELTAEFKASLIKGDSLIDLTGGFGVDALAFSKSFEHVTHCDWNENLSAIVRHNFKTFNTTKINVIASDGLTYLENSNANYDWIYIDPSRRHDSKGKVFFLNDCLPNIPKHLNLLWSHTKNLLIKTSPLLDLTVGLNELEFVKTIHIVAVKNDVKELLWILEHGYQGVVEIITTNLKTPHSEEFGFIMDSEATVEAPYSHPQTYLYEPNSAILKSGGFNSLTKTFAITKLHQHSHLYTSNSLIDFPGRRFKILTVLPYNKKHFKALGITKANITTRNFPESVEHLRKTFKIKDGGSQYVFFTTNLDNEKIVIVCAKTL